MLNPNVPKVVLNYEHTENLLAELTPNPRDFEGLVYPTEDVENDIKHLDDFESTPKYKIGEKRSDAKLLEKTFTDMVERGDWFGEEEAYGDDPEYLALITFPTSKIDDTFNHIDMIGIIANEATEHEVVPFAIDLTWNIGEEELTGKFKWKHVYGKKKDAPEGISEFGWMVESDSKPGVLEARSLPLRFRYGLKIPGFASAKYYEDKDNPQDPMYEKGRIDVMPRFIIGYSTDLVRTLADGAPTDEYRKTYGEAAYQKRKLEFKNAERCAKWCTLFECHKQASDIHFMLENMGHDETKWMRPEELEKAKKQIVAMDVYFTKAIGSAVEKAQTDPNEDAAMRYADRDVTCQAIISHSNDTYIVKSWQNIKNNL